MQCCTARLRISSSSHVQGFLLWLTLVGNLLFPVTSGKFSAACEAKKERELVSVHEMEIPMCFLTHLSKLAALLDRFLVKGIGAINKLLVIPALLGLLLTVILVTVIFLTMGIKV